MLVVKRKRPKIKNFVFGLAFLTLAFSTVFVIWTAVYFRGIDKISECHEDVQQDYPSPGGKLHALVAIQNCGATVSNVLRIHLSDTSSISKTEENLNASAVFSTSKISGLSVSWLDENNLEIRSPDAIKRSFKYKWLDKLIDVQIVAN